MTEEEIRLRELPDEEEGRPNGVAHRTTARRTWRETANRAVVNNFIFNKEQKTFYYENYTCIPNCKEQVGGPPIFIVTITLIELAVFIYYTVISHTVSWWTISTEAVASPLIFSPFHREEVWRFFTYMFLHAGLSHILTNSFIQLLVGIPLELVHGSLRVMGIYMIGIIAGSLGSSVFDVGAYLVGASGGDFALMFAFLANVIMNWDYMKWQLALIRISVVSLFILADFGTALYRRYGDFEGGAESNVSYAAHIAGSISGLTMGIILLKNFKRQNWEDILKWTSIAVFCVCILTAIFFNIFCPCYNEYV
ncbi:rhomboid-related protein 2-like isoform X2 [Styela clava]